MINQEIVSKRYADAFLAYAGEKIGRDRGLDELARAKRIFRDNPGLLELMNNPDITENEKFGVIDKVFGTDFAEETRHLMKLLIEKRRIGLFVDIAEYARIHYAHGVDLDALLKTSYPLETDTIHRIKDALENKLKHRLHLYLELDAEMLGGVYVRIGNIIMDGSVKRRLADAREKLLTLKVA